MDRVLRVLVVDDSAYVRKVVKQMLSRSPFIEVVGVARDGEEALELVEQLKPDVVTCDLIMPKMDGITFLRHQMAKKPIPVVIVSIASDSGEQALDALDSGAVEFVQKPTALATEKIFEVSDELIEKVKAAASVHVSRLQPDQLVTGRAVLTERKTSNQPSAIDIVVIGISTGGPQALRAMIPQFPADFPVPIAIVLHMPVGYTELYARKLNEVSQLRVVEASEGEPFLPGTVTIAQAGRHLLFHRDRENKVVAHLDARPFDTPHRPSADVMFQSAAETFGSRVLGVVMTGMGSDGKQGSAWIKAQGGTVYTEGEESCVVYGMPFSVDEAGLSDRSFNLNQMAQAILDVI